MPDRAITTGAAGAGLVPPHWPNTHTMRKDTAMADQGNISTPDAADLNAAAKRYCAEQGWAMPDGSYPIRPADNHGIEDLAKAIRAVGRGGASAATIRKHIIARAKAIGQAAAIPDTWRADGTLADPARAALAGGVFYREFAPDLEIRSSGDGRTIVGYAVPFDQPQVIDDFLTESFDRSSVDHQLPAIHRVGYYHGHRSQGGVHVGHIVSARPEPKGLYTESRVSKTQAGDELIEMIRDGSIPHQSVGFRVGPNGTQMRGGVAHRIRVDLTELAAVPEGAYGDGAAISGVRAYSADALPMAAAGEPCPCYGQIVPDDKDRARAEQARQALARIPILRA